MSTPSDLHEMRSNATVEPLPPVKSLILDAGPLLSLSPLRGLASRYLTVPLVLSELRDPKARTHWENLKLLSGVEVGVREPDALSMSKAIAWARHTGDFSVLSKADLSVLALTYAMEVEENGHRRIRMLPGEAPQSEGPSAGGPSAGAIGNATSAGSTSSPTSAIQPEASSSSAPLPSRPPPKSPWGIVPQVAAFDLSSQPVEELEEGEEGWAEDAEVERREQMVEALREIELREQDDDDSDGESDQLSDTGDLESDGEGSNPDNVVVGAGKTPVEETQAYMEREPSAPAPAVSGTSSVTPSIAPSTSTAPLKSPFQPVYAEAEVTSDDSEGEWITPSNVVTRKAVDLGMAPPSSKNATSSSSSAPNDDALSAEKSANSARKAAKKAKKLAAIAAASGGDGMSLAVQPRLRNHKMKAACMTGDYAVQNVLLQMGLNLVGEEGKRIEMVKSWVLRCHACFKICKDPSKKFCPSCGNASLIRASVTTSIDPNTQVPTQNVHLKSNFQYRTRGTKYSIPDPKMGSAKGQQRGGSGLILREDQREYQLGLRKETIRQEKEERKLDKAVKAMEEGKGGGTGNWNDPDYLPEILVVGLSGKGRQSQGDFLPQIGHGRRNPNQVRRGKK